jgi:chromosome partitioning protein
LSPFPGSLIRPTGIDGVSIVPGSRSLADYNMMSRDGWAASEHGIRDFLEEVSGSYDLILADAPPNLHLCSWAALVGSHGICVPLQCEDYRAQGLEPVQESVATVRATRNPGLRLIGYLPTMFDKRLGIHGAHESLLREEYGEDVFANPMPMAKDFKEAVAGRQPISHFRPRSAAAKAMRAIADELIDRIATRIIPAREVAA